MLGRGKPRHLDANVCDELLGRPLADTRDRVQERHALRKGATQRLNLGFTLSNTLCEALNMSEEVGEHLGMLGPEAPLQSSVDLKGARNSRQSSDLTKKQCIVGLTQLKNRYPLAQRTVHLSVA
jgi:hypothetical protein